jgi:hypothetical protein
MASQYRANQDWACQDSSGPDVPADADQWQPGPPVPGRTGGLPFCSQESQLVLAINR